MRKISIILSILTIVGSVSLSFYNNNWTWFSRSGSLLIFYAVFLEYLPIIKIQNVENSLFGRDKEGHTSVRYSAIIVLLGTLIWGFGDLLGTSLNVNYRHQIIFNTINSDLLKDYFLPIVIPFLSTFGAFVIAYYQISRNEMGKIERVKIDAGNDWILTITDTFDLLTTLKQNYFDKIDNNIVNRILVVPIFKVNRHPIKKEISSLNFILSESKDKWHQPQIIKAMLNNYNTLISYWNRFDELKEKLTESNIVTTNLIDLNETCIKLTDDLIIEMHSFLTEFPKIFIKNTNRKFGIRVFVQINEIQARFLNRVPEPNYNDLSRFLNMTIDQLKKRYDFGY